MIFPSNKIRVEIVLPLYCNDKTQIEPGKFLETRRGNSKFYSETGIDSILLLSHLGHFSVALKDP